MKDLYARLGIDPTASMGEIASLLAAGSRGGTPDWHAAREILLNPSRRRQYDRTREIVAHIATLRYHLGMPAGTERQPAMYQELTKPWSLESKPRVAAKDGTSGSRKESRSDSEQRVARYILGAATILVVAGLAFSDRQTPKSTAPQPAAVFSVPALPLPSTGEFYVRTAAQGHEIVVRTPHGAHYLVKVEGPTGEAARAFIRGGDSHTFELPMGVYTIETASGSVWYGDPYWFGPDTRFARADDTFPLIEPGVQWTVELIPQRHGNLSEVPIAREQF